MEKSELGHRPGGKRLPTLGYRVGAPAGGTSNGKAIVGGELQLHIPACGLRNGIRENQEAEGKEPQCSHRSRATSEMKIIPDRRSAQPPCGTSRFCAER